MIEGASRPGARARRDGGTRTVLDPDRLAELEDERDFLLRSLSDLDREHAAGDVDDGDYLALRDDYTARAAAVLHAIEERATQMDAVRKPRSPLRLVMVASVVVVVAVGAGWLVKASSGSRVPGDTITGDVRETSTAEVARAGQLISQAQTSLREGRSDDAVSAYRGAIDAYDRALELDPAAVEAMTYRGWLLHNLALQAPAGSAPDLDLAALDWLDRAVATDPTYADARVFRALLLEQAGRSADALADLAALDSAQLPAGMLDMVEAVRARLEAG